MIICDRLISEGSEAVVLMLGCCSDQFLCIHQPSVLDMDKCHLASGGSQELKKSALGREEAGECVSL